jgi:hypothetical protein
MPDFHQTYQDVLSTATTDSAFTIPFQSGNWNFFYFAAGAQAVANQSSKVELYFDQAGDGTNMQLIDAIYTDSETYQHNFDPNVLYTVGTNSRIVVRRTLLGGTTAREVFAQWQGSVV